MPFKVAISGLRASQTELNVIGNNVANVGTTGFKSSRAEFEDVYTLSNLGVAANSPGRGVNTSRIAQQFTQGNITFTDNNLDLAVSGQGFFMVDDAGTTMYTREGAFSVDREGFVVNANNQRLIIFGADKDALLAALDAIKAKRPESAALLLTPNEDEGKVIIVSAVPRPLIERGLKAGDWVREAAKACGGNGGGRPDSAQAGGKEPHKADDALAVAKQFARDALK